MGMGFFDGINGIFLNLRNGGRLRGGDGSGWLALREEDF
jgi:hypothetical protein